ncbi:MAG: nitroreductase family protein [Chloroflexi bacterium]|nr:nitroreductase family protein [Chloroflexota bacterium]
MTREFIQTIFARRSIRKYTSAPVSEADIQTLMEAAMAAPSASNRKPWYFIVVTKRQTLDALAEAHPHGKMLFDASLCIVVCGDVTEVERYWVQDCSAATENLLLAATALGLGAVWLGVYPKEPRIAFTRPILNLPETIVPLNLIAIGHPAEEKEPRTQYDESRVHRERW